MEVFFPVCQRLREANEIVHQIWWYTDDKSTVCISGWYISQARHLLDRVGDKGDNVIPRALIIVVYFSGLDLSTLQTSFLENR